MRMNEVFFFGLNEAVNVKMREQNPSEASPLPPWPQTMGQTRGSAQIIQVKICGSTRRAGEHVCYPSTVVLLTVNYGATDEEYLFFSLVKQPLYRILSKYGGMKPLTIVSF